MSKRNREKRAAKKRDRRRGPTPSRDGFAWGTHGPGCTCGHGDGPSSGGSDFWSQQSRQSQERSAGPDALAELLLLSARRQALGIDPGDPLIATTLADPRQERSVATAAGIALARVLDNLWVGGWMPADVWEITRRRVGEAELSLVVDAIAADTAEHAPATVHERWEAQTARLDAVVWWDGASPHLGQWARRQGMTVEHAVAAVITLLAELVALPALPRIVSPPGTATRAANSRTAAVDQKILARVRALLAKAESTQFPDEADALSAKAQELMNRYAFERALLDEDRTQTATATRFWLDSPYLEAKSHLVAAVAGANRCESVYHPKLGFVALVGEELDLEITELLATSLLVQATRAMVAEGSQITRAGTSRTRSFRQSFLVSYAVRIGERLTEAGTRAQDDTERDRLLPVLAARSRVVDETVRAMYSDLVQRTVSASNGAGWHAGRLAADRANLTIERQVIDA